MPTLILERQLGGRVAGLDEVGRGSLAGPVIAAAVVLNVASLPMSLLSEIDDSKRLMPKKREGLLTALTACADIGIGHADVAEIDARNILQATFLAMARAIDMLRGVDYAIIDGKNVPPLSCSVIPLVKGDSFSASIAAASIVAKVTRDRLMRRLAAVHPGYGWETNVGYGTTAHLNAMKKLGITPHHRRSFAFGKRIFGKRIPERQI